MAVVKRLSENQGARMFHLMMIIPAGLLLLLLSLISLGYMATANKNVNEKLDDLNADGRCILYTTKLKDGKFNEGGQCVFAVWGAAALAILAVVLSIVLGVKTFFGITVFSFLSIIELGLSVLGAVWALIVAIVITVGLDTTCKNYRDFVGADDNIPCCVITFLGTSETDAYFFYEDINTSRITVWFAMGLLFCLSILYGIILIIFCFRASIRRRGGSAAFTELPEAADE